MVAQTSVRIDVSVLTDVFSDVPGGRGKINVHGVPRFGKSRIEWPESNDVMNRLKRLSASKTGD